MPQKTITVAECGELRVSKNKRTYFLLKTTEDEQFICYKASLHPEFVQGVTQVVEYLEAKEGYSPSIVAIVGEQTEEPPPEPAEKRDGRNRVFALSYAKDIEIALIQAGWKDAKKYTQADTAQILMRAEIFNKYLEGESMISSEKIAQYIQGMIKSQIKKED